MCAKVGIKLVQLDLGKPIAEQGDFDIILHKTTDIISKALFTGNSEAMSIVQEMTEHSMLHSSVKYLDPVDRVCQLVFRNKQYEAVKACLESCPSVSVPKSVEISHVTEGSGNTVGNHIAEEGILYPVVVKSLTAHGSPDAHKMAIVFNEESTKSIRGPCLIQQFINHDAVLYKVFVVGSHFHVVQRPSIKNLDAGDMETIFFDSHDVSKANSSSSLNESGGTRQSDNTPDVDVVGRIVAHLSALGLHLYGVDIIRDCNTGRLCVIEVNIFPSYDGMPDFFWHLLALVESTLQSRVTASQNKKMDDLDKPRTASSVCPASLFITNDHINIGLT